MLQTINKLKGSMVAIVTPMQAAVKPEVGIDADALKNLIEFHINNGTDAIVAVGTTGESATLSETEHCALVSRVVELARKRVPVIAGTGANSTLEAVRLSESARQAGADACLLVTPYYNKPTQEGLYRHFRYIAENVDIPQIVYNVPSRTACDMQVETVARLAKLPNIIGIKDATGELERVTRLRDLCGDAFLLLSGDDLSTREFILRGGDGSISVTANVAPQAMHDMCAAALAGDAQKSAELDETLAGLHKNLFVESNPIPVKWALHR
ncbi:MAG: 4-hydroxy-tetrahydrodipicolinate synthase, partial [Candidatus Eutrophobiaceae bacterium]